MNEQPFSVLSITLVLRHDCGGDVVIHGDDWDDLHGECAMCGEEFDFSLTDLKIEDEAP